VLAHVVLLKLLDERYDGLIVSGLRWELDALRVEPVATDGAEVFVVCDVEEVDVLLCLLVTSTGDGETTVQVNTYTAKLPFAFFRHPSRLTGRQLDEVLVRLCKCCLGVLEDDLRFVWVRSTCNEGRRTQRQQ
jgi:hypothetical protein